MADIVIALSAALVAKQLLHRGRVSLNLGGLKYHDVFETRLRVDSVLAGQSPGLLRVLFRSEVITPLENLLRTIRSEQKSPLPRFLSPWVFDKKPNPVIFGHVYHATPVGNHSRWRHVPIDMSHVSFAEEVQETMHEETKPETVDLDADEDEEAMYEETDFDGMDLDADDNNSIQDLPDDMDLVADNNSVQDIEDSPTQPEPPDKKETTCSYCGHRFPTPGKMK
jgi:hypothetical protein